MVESDSISEYLSSNYEIMQDGCIIFYTCKRCGFRFISVFDALSHRKACLEHPEWQEEHRNRESEKCLLRDPSLDFFRKDL